MLSLALLKIKMAGRVLHNKYIVSAALMSVTFIMVLTFIQTPSSDISCDTKWKLQPIILIHVLSSDAWDETRLWRLNQRWRDSIKDDL